MKLEFVKLKFQTVLRMLRRPIRMSLRGPIGLFCHPERSTIGGEVEGSRPLLSFPTWSGISFVLIALFFAACSDFGERDNPLDPGADNYVAQIDEPESSSDNKDPELAEGSSSSKNVKSSSSAVKESSSSGGVSSNSSKVPEPAEGSSSSKNVKSSSSVVKEFSSSGGMSSSSSKVPEPTEESSSSSMVAEPAEESSSSIKVAEPAEGSSSSSHCEGGAEGCDEAISSSTSSWTCGNSTVTRGDREYKTVVIKEQCWIKENLRYLPSSGNTMCYGNDESNCDTYGLLYDYEAASLACPTGWRLPTSDEYIALAEYSMEGATLYDAGAHFKATEGWSPENGDDFLEFTALPGGKCDETKNCKNVGTLGYWWTSTEKVKNTSHLVLSLNGDTDSYSATAKMDNDQFISVRCVKK